MSPQQTDITRQSNSALHLPLWEGQLVQAPVKQNILCSAAMNRALGHWDYYCRYSLQGFGEFIRQSA